MDGLDVLLLFLRPVAFVILPAWGFHEWIGEAALGALLGFAYMWNFMATHENAELAQAFKEVRDELEEIKLSVSGDQS